MNKTSFCLNINKINTNIYKFQMSMSNSAFKPLAIRRSTTIATSNQQQNQNNLQSGSTATIQAQGGGAATTTSNLSSYAVIKSGINPTNGGSGTGMGSPSQVLNGQQQIATSKQESQGRSNNNGSSTVTIQAQVSKNTHIRTISKEAMTIQQQKGRKDYSQISMLSAQKTQRNSQSQVSQQHQLVSAATAVTNQMKQIMQAAVANKTPQLTLGGNAPNDYYSVQSNISSRNVNQANAATAIVKKSALIHHQASSSSVVRNSTSSRNQSNYQMIKTSNIIVTQPIHTTVLNQGGGSNTNSKNAPQTLSTPSASGRQIKQNQLHYHQMNAANGCSPPNKGGTRTTVNVSHVANNGQINDVTPTLTTRQQQLMTLTPVLNKEHQTQQIDHKFNTRGATTTSVERGKQAARGISLNPKPADGPLGLPVTQQRLSLIQQQIQNYQLQPASATLGSSSRRASKTFGASPMTLCSHHQQYQKQGTTPLKSSNQMQQSAQGQLSNNKNNNVLEVPVSNAAAALMDKASPFQYYPAVQTEGDLPLFNKSLVLIEGSQKHNEKSAQKAKDILPMSPKQQPIEKGAHQSAILSYNSPTTTNAQQQVKTQASFTTGILSPGMSPMTSKHYKKQQAAADQQVTARLSTGTGKSNEFILRTKPMNQRQNSQGVANKASKNIQSAASLLQIDLKQLNNKERLNSSGDSAILENDNEEQSTFHVYNATGDAVPQIRNEKVSKASNKVMEKHQTTPMVVPPQPMLVQLNAQSPLGSNTIEHQFFAKSPKSSNKPSTTMNSSNRPSLLTSQAHKHENTTSRHSHTQATFQQQTKSSLAKAQAVKQQVTQREAIREASTKESNAQNQSNTLKSKTQRMNHNTNTKQTGIPISKTVGQSKVPSKFETSLRKQPPNANNEVQIVVVPPLVLDFTANKQRLTSGERIKPTESGMKTKSARSQKKSVGQSPNFNESERENHSFKEHSQRTKDQSKERPNNNNNMQTANSSPENDRIIVEVDTANLLFNGVKTPSKNGMSSPQHIEVSEPRIIASGLQSANIQHNSGEKRIKTPIQQKSPKKDEPLYPCTRNQFLSKNADSLTLKQRIETKRELKENEMIYYPGLILKMTDDPFELTPEIKILKCTSKSEEIKGSFMNNEKENSNQKEEKANNKKPFDDEDGYYQIKIGDHLLYRYEILKILGKGSFAQVVSCMDHKYLLETGQERLVAIKITRNTELDHKFALGEAKLLQFLMDKDPEDKYNIVRLLDEFVFRDHHCFVFELLPSGDLFEHLKASNFQGFPLARIKQYTREILKALVFLETHNVIHCDLKPENILLVEHKEEGNNQKILKLVDFGSGSFRGEQVYTYVQSRFYRAPEVILRLLPTPHSYTEKVDIWSLGCIIAELFTGEPLFPGNNEQEQLELIMELCGIPPASLIDRCRKKDHYFDVDYSPFLIEDDVHGILRIPDNRKLHQIIHTDDLAFIDFIKNCLELDPDKRFSASQAMQHPWIKEEKHQNLDDWSNMNDQTAKNFGHRKNTIDEGSRVLAPLDLESQNNENQRLDTFGVEDSRHLDSRKQSEFCGQETNSSHHHFGGQGEGRFIQQSSSGFINQEDLPVNVTQRQGGNDPPHQQSQSQLAFIAATSSMRRGRETEDFESGVRGAQFEESPQRDATLDKPRGTLAQQHQQQFLLQAIRVETEPTVHDEEEKEHDRVQLPQNQKKSLLQKSNGDSKTSTPKDEGGIQYSVLIPTTTTLNQNNIDNPQVAYVDADLGQIEENKDGDQMQFDQSSPSYLPPSIIDSGMTSPLDIYNNQGLKFSKKKVGVSPLNTSTEKRRDRSARKRAAEAAGKTPNKGSMIIVQQSPLPDQQPIKDFSDVSSQQKPSNMIQMIGQYEIFREDDSPMGGPGVRESMNSHTSGIASEANIPPVHQNRHEVLLTTEQQNSTKLAKTHSSQNAQNSSPTKRSTNLNQVLGNSADAMSSQHQMASQSSSQTGANNGNNVTAENTINKITITFYQKRHNNNSNNVNTHASQPSIKHHSGSGQAPPKKHR